MNISLSPFPLSVYIYCDCFFVYFLYIFVSTNFYSVYLSFSWHCLRSDFWDVLNWRAYDRPLKVDLVAKARGKWERWPATSLLLRDASAASVWETFMILSCCCRAESSSFKSNGADVWMFWTLWKRHTHTRLNQWVFEWHNDMRFLFPNYLTIVYFRGFPKQGSEPPRGSPDVFQKSNKI